MTLRGRGWGLGLACSLWVLGACSAREPAPGPVGGVEEHVGDQVPLDTAFTTSTGAHVQLGDVLGRGKPALLVLAYSRCSMLCSLVVRAASDLVPALGLQLGKDYSLVTVSIDPRETPLEAGRTRELALARAGHPGTIEEWPFLVGEAASVRRLAQGLGFRYEWDERTQQYAHPAVLFVLSPTGRIAGYFYDLRPDPAAVRAALVRDPSREGPAVARLGAAVLSCFRFDPLGRKYGPLLQGYFQVGAAGVALGLGYVLTSLFRRERRARREVRR